ncbi:unnamed protein product [Gongylonema pulchrum]|uniref:G_PROTEIN_RECEP_F1_2 domain-containing protein n=1 Tax=Gongylonema pulchrum TaxID=637853 RepID=A0A183DFC5_9BILA|nr:unnamed protein product [Gongylonema pulchrum]
MLIVEEQQRINLASLGLDDNLEIQWGYLSLAVVPVICVLGNCMVIAAVWRTKVLQTPTNYLLVSLAVADLVIGLFAMPFSIYLSVSLLILFD